LKFREDKKDNPLSKSVHTFVVDVAENVEIHVVEPISRKYVVLLEFVIFVCYNTNIIYSYKSKCLGLMLKATIIMTKLSKKHCSNYI